MRQRKTAELVRTTRTDQREVLVYTPTTKRERKVAAIRQRMVGMDRTSPEYSRLGWMVSFVGAVECGNEILGGMAL